MQVTKRVLIIEDDKAIARLLRDNLEYEGFVVETKAPPGFESGGGKPRFYRITALGRRTCAAEAERLASFVDAARAKRLLKA